MIIIDVCSIVSVLLCISWLFISSYNLDKINKELKSLKENQFDAEQVLTMYEMKYNRPVVNVTQEKADIKCLYHTIELPYDLVKDISQGRVSEKEVIENELTYRFSKMITPYIEYEIDKDVISMTRVVNARLRVIENSKH